MDDDDGCREDDDSDDERNRNAEDKETEIMEDLALAQAMEPQSDVSFVCQYWIIKACFCCVDFAIYLVQFEDPFGKALERCQACLAGGFARVPFC